jgi:hypothetical protein
MSSASESLVVSTAASRVFVPVEQEDAGGTATCSGNGTELLNSNQSLPILLSSNRDTDTTHSIGIGSN